MSYIPVALSVLVLLVLQVESVVDCANVVPLLNNISSTTESISNAQSITASDITNLNASLNTLQSQLSQSLADVEESISNLSNRIKQLESKLGNYGVRPSPHTLRSCSEIKQYWPELPSDYYTLTDIYGQQHHNVFCNMDNIMCGSTEGWTRVAYLNMSNSDHNCNLLGEQFHDYSSISNKRACGKNVKNLGLGCISKKFDNFNVRYSEVCGKVLAYQYWSPDGISSSVTDIESHYIDGVSLTYGSPRQHIWSFMGGFSESNPKCPCANSNYPTYSFIGKDYFCESGTDTYRRTLFTDDLLWDAQDCNGNESGCCKTGSWFNKVLSGDINEDIELRLCGNSSDEDTPLVYYELYVK